MNPVQQAGRVTTRLLGTTGPTGWLVSNETRDRLRLKARDGSLLLLSPLERDRRVSSEELSAFALEQRAQEGLVSLIPEPSPRVRRLSSITTFGFVLSALLALYGVGADAERSLLLALLLLLGCVGLEWLLSYLRAEQGRPRTFLNQMGWRFNIFLLVFVGSAIPVLLIVCTDGFWLHLDTVLHSPLQASGASQRILVGRFLQLLVIGTLSLLPAMLFFSFDREHLGTLRDRFTAQMFRFDPSVRTKRDIRARYGRVMDEVYGPERYTGAVRYMPSRRSPLFVASLVLTLGWTLTLVSSNVQPDPRGELSILSFFVPLPATITFGFLGAYYYALHTIFRSYTRRDLQPKTYSHITTRVVTVLTLSWVLDDVWQVTQQLPQGSRSVLHALVFVTGIIPETGLVFLQELLRSSALKLHKMLKLPGHQLVDRHEPLTSLDGIDLYDRARLQDEGVTNVEGLAHHDLCELMLQTRIPLPRLLDWVDQAILRLHTTAEAEHDEAGSFKLLENLRRHGIRTATDLLEAHEQAIHRNQEDVFLEKLSGDPAGTALPRLRTLLDAIQNEHWLNSLRYWHSLHPVLDKEFPPEETSAPRGAPLQDGDGTSAPGVVKGDSDVEWPAPGNGAATHESPDARM
jgi:hypothetical protein